MKILEIAAVIGGGIVLLWVFSIGWSKNEIVECQKWLGESRRYIGWYSTDWQREQCKAHGLDLPERYKP